MLWGTFVAINWPADTGAGRGIRADRPYTDTTGPRVWETWKQEWESSPKNLDDWDSYAAKRPPCDYVEEEPGNRQSVTAADWPGIYRKYGTVLNLINTASRDDKKSARRSGGPLIDGNGEYVRYEIRYNRELYDCLHHGAGDGCVNKPGEQLTFPAANASKVGAISLKAAWRKMTPIEEAEKGSVYYMRRVLVVEFESAPGETKAKSVCRAETMGLVGMHIVYKHDHLKGPDAASPSNAWTWFTIEHKDNPPPCPKRRSKGRSSSFGRPWDSSFSYRPEPRTPESAPPAEPQPVWLCRETATDEVTADENRKFQEILSAYPPWGNYEFVTGQWRAGSTANITRMANTIIEPYAQRDSCMDCHTGNSQKTDFVWSLCIQRDWCNRRDNPRTKHVTRLFATPGPSLASPEAGAPPGEPPDAYAVPDPWHFGEE
ncbi:hypothetical protein BE15_06510 [Sorangium cellulosum]|uniref:Cytochrome c family protein n=1 Tax=Sorangium cellulosum TaxID=56 RepID=A0A150QX81_SORCE|nr:hypothetical protein BE15_06510 [Sorangium cellulosum]